MPVKKKPTAKQLAARKKFVEMVRAKAKAKKAGVKKSAPKKKVVKKRVSGLDSVKRKGKKTQVNYTRISGIKPLPLTTQQKKIISDIKHFRTLVDMMATYYTAASKTGVKKGVETQFEAENIISRILKNKKILPSSSYYIDEFQHTIDSFNYWKLSHQKKQSLK